MGNITDIGKSIYSDGPVTAPTQPDKGRIRNELLPAIEGAVEGAAAGLVRAWDWSGLQATPGTRNGQPGVVEGPDYGTHNDLVGGASVTNRGNYSWYAPGNVWRWVSTISNFAGDIAALQTQQAAEVVARLAVDAKIPDITKQSGIRHRHVTGTKRKNEYLGDTYGPTPWKTWLVAINPPHNVQDPSAIAWWLLFGETPAQIGHRVVERDGAVGNGGPNNFIFPGDHPTDRILLDLTWYDAGDIIKDPDIPALFQQAVFPVEKLGPFRNDRIYWTQVFARNAAGQRIDIGCVQGRMPVGDSIDPLWKKGIGSQSTVLGVDSVGVAAGMIAVALYESIYEDGSAGASANPMRIAYANPRALDLTQAETVNGAWSLRIPISSVDLQPAPIADDALGEYRPAVGKVTASNKVRYDVLTQDPDSGSLLVVSGAERTVNRDVNEYIPEVTNFPVVANLRVHSAGVEIIKRNEFEGFVRIGQEARHMAWLERNRSLLPNTMRCLRRGLPIRLIGYGDSITAFGGAEYYTPNGPNRDRIEFLNNYDADTLAAIPRFDGDAGAGMHVHLGHNWYIKAAMEQRWGSLVEYLNMGIGGTTSYDTFVDGIGPNGLYPARINALKGLISPGQTLVVLSFGMNELTNPPTFNNLVQIAAEIKAAGGEVLMTTCMRPGRSNGPWVNTEWWLSVCRRTIRAAYAAQTAFVSSVEIFGPGNEGAVGLSKHTLCDANGSNHPGVYELRKFGEYAGLIFA